MCCDKMQMRDFAETMCEYGKNFSVAATEMLVAYKLKAGLHSDISVSINLSISRSSVNRE